MNKHSSGIIKNSIEYSKSPVKSSIKKAVLFNEENSLKQYLTESIISNTLLSTNIKPKKFLKSYTLKKPKKFETSKLNKLIQVKNSSKKFLKQITNLPYYNKSNKAINKETIIDEQINKPSSPIKELHMISNASLNPNKIFKHKQLQFMMKNSLNEEENLLDITSKRLSKFSAHHNSNIKNINTNKDNKHIAFQKGFSQDSKLTKLVKISNKNSSKNDNKDINFLSSKNNTIFVNLNNQSNMFDNSSLFYDIDDKYCNSESIFSNELSSFKNSNQKCNIINNFSSKSFLKIDAKAINSNMVAKSEPSSNKLFKLKNFKAMKSFSAKNLVCKINKDNDNINFNCNNKIDNINDSNNYSKLQNKKRTHSCNIGKKMQIKLNKCVLSKFFNNDEGYFESPKPKTSDSLIIVNKLNPVLASNTKQFYIQKQLTTNSLSIKKSRKAVSENINDKFISKKNKTKTKRISLTNNISSNKQNIANLENIANTVITNTSSNNIKVNVKTSPLKQIKNSTSKKIRNLSKFNNAITTEKNIKNNEDNESNVNNKIINSLNSNENNLLSIFSEIANDKSNKASRIRDIDNKDNKNEKTRKNSIIEKANLFLNKRKRKPKSKLSCNDHKGDDGGLFNNDSQIIILKDLASFNDDSSLSNNDKLDLAENEEEDDNLVYNSNINSNGNKDDDIFNIKLISNNNDESVLNENIYSNESSKEQSDKERKTNIIKNNKEYNDNGLNNAKTDKSYNKVKIINNQSNRRALLRKKHVYDSLSDSENEKLQYYSAYIIHPESTFLRVYFTIFFVFLILSNIGTPLIVAFNIEIYYSFFILDFLLDFLLISFIFINFIIGFFDLQDNYVTNAKIIANRYLKRYFILDFILAIPVNSIFNIIELNTVYNLPYHFNDQLSPNIDTSTQRFFTNYFSRNNSNHVYFNSLRLIRGIMILRIINLDCFNIMDYLIYTIKKIKQLETFIVSLIFIIKILIFFHISSCIWIHFHYLRPQKNWIIEARLNDYDFIDLYISSIYFNMATILTVGYGDIIPSNIVERVYCSIVMLLGILIYTYIISSLSNYVYISEESSKELNDKIELVNDLRVKYNLNELYINQIKGFLNNTYTKNFKFKYEFLISNLPLSLKKEIFIPVYKAEVSKYSIFKALNYEKDIDVLLMILSSLKNAMMWKRETPIIQNNMVDEIVFVKSGKFSLFRVVDLDLISKKKIGVSFEDYKILLYLAGNSDKNNLMRLKSNRSFKSRNSRISGVSGINGISNGLINKDIKSSNIISNSGIVSSLSNKKNLKTNIQKNFIKNFRLDKEDDSAEASFNTRNELINKNIISLKSDSNINENNDISMYNIEPNKLSSINNKSKSKSKDMSVNNIINNNNINHTNSANNCIISPKSKYLSSKNIDDSYLSHYAIELMLEQHNQEQQKFIDNLKKNLNNKKLLNKITNTKGELNEEEVKLNLFENSNIGYNKSLPNIFEIRQYKKINLIKLRAGDCFGDYLVFNEKASPFSLEVVTEKANIFSLSKADYEKIIAKYKVQMTHSLIISLNNFTSLESLYKKKVSNLTKLLRRQLIKPKLNIFPFDKMRLSEYQKIINMYKTLKPEELALPKHINVENLDFLSKNKKSTMGYDKTNIIPSQIVEKYSGLLKNVVEDIKIKSSQNLIKENILSVTEDKLTCIKENIGSNKGKKLNYDAKNCNLDLKYSFPPNNSNLNNHSSHYNNIVDDKNKQISNINNDSSNFLNIKFDNMSSCNNSNSFNSRSFSKSISKNISKNDILNINPNNNHDMYFLNDNNKKKNSYLNNFSIQEMDDELLDKSKNTINSKFKCFNKFTLNNQSNISNDPNKRNKNNYNTTISKGSKIKDISKEDILKLKENYTSNDIILKRRKSKLNSTNTELINTNAAMKIKNINLKKIQSHGALNTNRKEGTTRHSLKCLSLSGLESLKQISKSSNSKYNSKETNKLQSKDFVRLITKDKIINSTKSSLMNKLSSDYGKDLNICKKDSNKKNQAINKNIKLKCKSNEVIYDNKDEAFNRIMEIMSDLRDIYLRNKDNLSNLPIKYKKLFIGESKVLSINTKEDKYYHETINKNSKEFCDNAISRDGVILKEIKIKNDNKDDNKSKQISCIFPFKTHTSDLTAKRNISDVNSNKIQDLKSKIDPKNNNNKTRNSYKIAINNTHSYNKLIKTISKESKNYDSSNCNNASNENKDDSYNKANNIKSLFINKSRLIKNESPISKRSSIKTKSVIVGNNKSLLSVTFENTLLKSKSNKEENQNQECQVKETIPTLFNKCSDSYNQSYSKDYFNSSKSNKMNFIIAKEKDFSITGLYTNTWITKMKDIYNDVNKNIISPYSSKIKISPSRKKLKNTFTTTNLESVFSEEEDLKSDKNSLVKNELTNSLIKIKQKQGIIRNKLITHNLSPPVEMRSLKKSLMFLDNSENKFNKSFNFKNNNETSDFANHDSEINKESCVKQPCNNRTTKDIVNESKSKKKYTVQIEYLNPINTKTLKNLNIYSSKESKLEAHNLLQADGSENFEKRSSIKKKSNKSNRNYKHNENNNQSYEHHDNFSIKNISNIKNKGYSPDFKKSSVIVKGSIFNGNNDFYKLSKNKRITSYSSTKLDRLKASDSLSKKEVQINNLKLSHLSRKSVTKKSNITDNNSINNDNYGNFNANINQDLALDKKAPFKVRFQNQFKQPDKEKATMKKLKSNSKLKISSKQIRKYSNANLTNYNNSSSNLNYSDIDGKEKDLKDSQYEKIYNKINEKTRNYFNPEASIIDFLKIQEQNLNNSLNSN